MEHPDQDTEVYPNELSLQKVRTRASPVNQRLIRGRTSRASILAGGSMASVCGREEAVKNKNNLAYLIVSGL